MRKVALGFSFAATTVASSHVDMFEEFLQTFERKYEAEEKQLRLKIFKAKHGDDRGIEREELEL